MGHQALGSALQPEFRLRMLKTLPLTCEPHEALSGQLPHGGVDRWWL